MTCFQIQFTSHFLKNCRFLCFAVEFWNLIQDVGHKYICLIEERYMTFPMLPLWIIYSKVQPAKVYFFPQCPPPPPKKNGIVRHFSPPICQQFLELPGHVESDHVFTNSVAYLWTKQLCKMSGNEIFHSQAFGFWDMGHRASENSNTSGI
jgi:hypothetical protein